MAAITIKFDIFKLKNHRILNFKTNLLGYIDNLFVDIYNAFWWFLVNLGVLIPKLPSARQETLRVFFKCKNPKWPTNHGNLLLLAPKMIYPQYQ